MLYSRPVWPLGSILLPTPTISQWRRLDSSRVWIDSLSMWRVSWLGDTRRIRIVLILFLCTLGWRCGLVYFWFDCLRNVRFIRNVTWTDATFRCSVGPRSRGWVIASEVPADCEACQWSRSSASRCACACRSWPRWAYIGGSRGRWFQWLVYSFAS